MRPLFRNLKVHATPAEPRALEIEKRTANCRLTFISIPTLSSLLLAPFNMKQFIVATLLTSAAAFAPAGHRAAAPGVATSVAASNNKFANEIGTQAPLGFWDPMGFLSAEDQSQFDWIREAEIKHGRIAMLAVTGYLTTYAGVRLPGMEDVPCGFGVFDKSLYTSDLAQTNIWWTVVTFLTLELVIVKDANYVAKHPGDYLNGFGTVRWDSKPEALKRSSREKELNNGRAAMMGILGLMVHEQLGNVDSLLPWLSKGGV